ncbi:ATP-dependent helicase [Nakamurella sp. DB0629]|uniref:DNA 3'-5' helicase n=2 Tax=Nakamurella aerolata TaxID=1656892 RepID=A0A849AB84_9ACTN|nr:ATP-dependent helicase [Nakamurella aerolata]
MDPAAPLTAAAIAARLGLPSPTAEQTAVIEAPLEPALVVAGAGSGKTETMAARVVYLVANGLVQPEQILGLTFTRKAAAQLAERIRRRLTALARSGWPPADRGAGAAALADQNAARIPAGLGAEPDVATYHAFAGRLIAEYGPLIGVEPSARVLTPSAAWQLARRVVGTWDGELATELSADKVTETLLELSGALADHLRDGTDLSACLDTLINTLASAPPSARQSKPLHSDLERRIVSLQNRRWILPLVAAYARAKRESNSVDFADQMQLAARLVREYPAIRRSMRERYRVALLDEYQDTGHAQRVILRALFGVDPDLGGEPGFPVTAVGDPVQSIYSWRGASASNLLRFGEDFPGTREAAPRFGLLTSFRNPPQVLALANSVSAAVRTDVGDLRPRPGAPDGEVLLSLQPTQTAENQWLADQIADRWFAGEQPPTLAVLMRRRREMADLADELTDRGIPVEVVGLGGLLAEPEVADVVAVLTLLVDPNSATAALRLLTGARAQLGAADLAALAERARQLGRAGQRRPADHRAGPAPAVPAGSTDHELLDDGQQSALAAMRAALAEAAAGAREIDDAVSLVDAIADPGPPQAYSPAGYRRLQRLAADLRALRTRLDQPLSELLIDVERTIGLDMEVAAAGPEGRSHLDAFAAVVADFEGVGGGVPELLDFLRTAEAREDGLPPGEIEVAAGRVQLLTVHAAKGLEWDVVAVPHLSGGVFPSGRTTSWLGEAGQLPPMLRGDAADVPQLGLPVGDFREDAGVDQGDLVKSLAAHTESLKEWQLREERRLAYVAVTRAQRELILSGHQWGSTGVRPRGPSPLLTELAAAADGVPGCRVDGWADAPAEGEANPALAEPRSTTWPRDPLRQRREQVERGAQLVRQALAGELDPADPRDPLGLAADVDALLAERSAARPASVDVELPGTLTVSSLVELAGDPEQLARRLRRPVPMPPAPQARRGTAFHLWLEHRFAGNALVAVEELPGADDRDAPADQQLERLQQAFEASTWADRVPVQIEVGFSMVLTAAHRPLPVRGRIDAVFADADGGYTVVDWKTGRPPSRTARAAVAVQLAAYRLAWAELAGVPLQRVRAAFHYVADNLTLAPVDLLDADGLARLIDAAVSDAAVSDGAGPGGAGPGGPVSDGAVSGGAVSDNAGSASSGAGIAEAGGAGSGTAEAGGAGSGTAEAGGAGSGTTNAGIASARAKRPARRRGGGSGP